MAASDKLHKALEALNIIHSSTTPSDDVILKNKEKIGLCVLVTDMMCSPDTKIAPNFSYLLSHSMETLLKLCDDQDSNIRMIADECLNRIIKVQMHTNASKINLELHKEIKRNGPARSLRAALWRFAELAHLIRPAKGRPYMQSLAPCVIKIAARSEEAVLETLASALPKILSSLGPFMNDNEAKQLINVFMKNIHSENAVLRRTAASSILGICIHSQKPQAFVIHTITSLLDLVLPVKDDLSSYTILGVLNCLRSLIPHVANDGKETFLRGSFGVKRKTNKQVTLSIDSIIQIFELCLHWTQHSDHNVTTAALETLNELLTTPPKDLITILIDSHGLGRSRILTAPLKKLSSKALSEVSVATISAVDDSQLLDADDDLSSSKVSAWLQGTVREPHLSPSQLPLQRSLLSHSTLDSLSDYPDSESLASEDISLLLKEETRLPSPEPEVFMSRDSPSPPPNINLIMDWDIGNVTDGDLCPLLFCARRLVTAFLIPECSSVRVSVRALALSCLCQVLKFILKCLLKNWIGEARKRLQESSMFMMSYDYAIIQIHS
uniref:Huntingtin n=1 Tax=Lygus hesperus TaxID=30085 RepID=A0A0K8SGM1_LYGHE